MAYVHLYTHTCTHYTATLAHLHACTQARVRERTRSRKDSDGPTRTNTDSLGDYSSYLYFESSRPPREEPNMENPMATTEFQKPSSAEVM